MSTVLDRATGKPKNPQDVEETSIDNDEYSTRLELLYEVAQKASSYSEVVKLIQEILGVTQRKLNAEASSLLLLDEEEGELCFQTSDGEAANTVRQVKLDLNSGIVGWVARNGKPVVANDVSRDNRFNKDIDEFSDFPAKSIVAVPLIRGHKVIGVLEAVNKVDGSLFNDQDLAVLMGYASTEALILLVSMAATAMYVIKLRQVELSGHKRTVETLVSANDVKDPYACGHSQRVKEYTLLAADSLPFTPEELQYIEFGALLHDIGKIGIDDCILRKPASLTDQEWFVMRKHSLIGANIVGEIPFLEKAKGIVLNHHEWYDGTGYPEGLKGEDIPIGARLVAVADAFDTMITDHSYRAALSVNEAMNELIRGIGTQFCPVAVGAFISAFRRKKESLEKMEAERVAREVIEKQAQETVRVEDAEYAAAWRSKGTALGRMGRDEEALEAFERAIELEPKNMAAWRNKGTALVRLGRNEEALEAFVKAIELDHNHAEAWSSKFAALVGLGKDEEARKIKDAEKLVKREANQVAKDRAKRETGEARKARDAEALIREETDQAAGEDAEEGAEEAGKAGGAEELREKEASQTTNEEVKTGAEEANKTRDGKHGSIWSNKVAALVGLGRNEKAKESKDMGKLEEKEADQKIDEKAKRKKEKDRKAKDTGASVQRISSETYEGDVRLAIDSAADLEQVNQFRKCLRKVEDLRITFDSWSENDGIIITVSLQKPLPIVSILSQMPIVEQVNRENKHLVVVLESQQQAEQDT